MTSVAMAFAHPRPSAPATSARTSLVTRRLPRMPFRRLNASGAWARVVCVRCRAPLRRRGRAPPRVWPGSLGGQKHGRHSSSLGRNSGSDSSPGPASTTACRAGTEHLQAELLRQFQERKRLHKVLLEKLDRASESDARMAAASAAKSAASVAAAEASVAEAGSLTKTPEEIAPPRATAPTWQQPRRNSPPEQRESWQPQQEQQRKTIPRAPPAPNASPNPGHSASKLHPTSSSSPPRQQAASESAQFAPTRRPSIPPSQQFTPPSQLSTQYTQRFTAPREPVPPPSRPPSPPRLRQQTHPPSQASAPAPSPRNSVLADPRSSPPSVGFQMPGSADQPGATPPACEDSARAGERAASVAPVARGSQRAGGYQPPTTPSQPAPRRATPYSPPPPAPRAQPPQHHYQQQPAAPPPASPYQHRSANFAPSPGGLGPPEPSLGEVYLPDLVAMDDYQMPEDWKMHSSPQTFAELYPELLSPQAGATEELPPSIEDPPLAGDNVTNLVFVASECAPWSKTGGLGDVVGSLPKALAKRGHRVMVVAPRYKNYPEALDTGVRTSYPVFGSDQEVGYFHAYIDRVDFVFVDHSCYHHVQDSIYSGEREQQNFRFALLSRAALEAVWHLTPGGVNYGDHNTVFVANDWQTALLPVYLQAYYRDHGKMLGSRSMLVMHNIAHQGRGPFDEIDRLMIPDNYKDMFLLDDPFGGKHMNILKAGLMAAHRWVAVSDGYAWEICTDMGGKGLAPTLNQQSWKVNGVVNGIDYAEWSPHSDAHLDPAEGYQQFQMSAEGIRTGKAACKAALQRELGLPVRPNVPLLGFIGRLDPQKGVDQIIEASGWMMSQDCQLVLLGSGDHQLEAQLRNLENSHGDKCRAWVGFSVKMAHRINASCDILLMPSTFEPCGLNQLYAQRYGTVPVVHSVGGLRDTVEQFNPWENTGTGWKYEPAETDKFIKSVSDAMLTYREHRGAFIGIQERGMARDFSWSSAAINYENIIIQAKGDDYRG